MAERKPFLLRLEPATLEALQRWAADELRSLNGQIEFVLRRALQEAGRASRAPSPGAPQPRSGSGRDAARRRRGRPSPRG